MSNVQKLILLLLGLIACAVIAIVGIVGLAMVSQNQAAPGGPPPTSGPSPTPIIYDWEGQGDDVIFFDAPQAGPGFMSAWYGGDGNFAVTLYRADGDYIDLLVNTIDEYEGQTTYRIARSGQYYLEIEASGHDYIPKWHIKMIPPQ